jgi:hypothetical protein
MQQRRATDDRRRSVFHALWHGNFARRRHAPRRRTERHVVITDWFQAQWLAVCVGILSLCSADALLTLTLISNGSFEINPLMDLMLRCLGHIF